MADAGAQEIGDLLDAKDPRFTKSGKRLVVALKHAPNKKRGIPAPIAFAAIDDIRRAYVSLSGQIASIQTSSPAKADVLDALQAADRGFAALDEALREGVNKPGAKLARKAHRLAKQAAKQMKSARAGLA
jgi:hypothetical protein